MGVCFIKFLKNDIFINIQNIILNIIKQSSDKNISK